MTNTTRFSYPAPAALVEHCRRRTTTVTSADGIGTTDPEAIRTLIGWLAERDAFDDYTAWCGAGMICKLELGDAGLDVWALTHNDTVTADVIQSKWNSFAGDASGCSPDDLQKIGSLVDRARKMGWTGHLRSSATWMFRNIPQVDVFGKPVNVNPAPVAPTRAAPTPATAATVAALAQAAGASLPGPIPLTDAQRVVATMGQQILDEFLAGTTDTPTFPRTTDYPKLPDNCESHPLYEPMNAAITRMMSMAEHEPRQFRQSRVLPSLAVLYAVHQEVCERLYQRLISSGALISPGQFDSAVKGFENKVRREINTGAGFILDTKGNPAADNSDNVAVFARMDGKRFRMNVWKDVAEYASADKDDWSHLSDAALDDLLVRAENSQYNYHPSKERFRRGLLSLARETQHDPVLEYIANAAAKWDGVPRLATWLHHTCNVPADAYHAAVGANIIGGMVRRARHPGCKHDECAIFISPKQGTGKSTLTKILAIVDDWHVDTLKLGGRQQDIVPQLAGKWVVELQELAGMSKTEVEDVKAFISTQSDNYTRKYEAFAGDHPRRCIFIGTSNNKRPLQDDSGNRRFLPVHVEGDLNDAWLRANVEQLIGEAAVRESNGDEFKIPREIWGVAEEHQEAARYIAPAEELIAEWFDRPAGQSYYITSHDLNNALRMSSVKARYAAHMDKLGWRYENLKLPLEGKRSRLWIRHHNNNIAECVRLVPIQSQASRPVEMRMLPAATAGTGASGGPVGGMGGAGMPPPPY